MSIQPHQNGSAAHADEGRPARIAIVEDEIVVAWSLQSVAEELGHEVVGVFADGEAALEVLAGETIDLLFIDINLGEGIDGIETARRLRERQQLGVLFVTGYADPETRSRVAHAVPGAKLIRKPVPRDLLAEAIAEISTSR